MVARLLLLLPLGLLITACGASKGEVRELEERIAQLEDENAQLRKGIVPAAAAAAAVPVDPGDAPAWGAKPGDPGEEVVEEQPPGELVPDVPLDTPEATPAEAHEERTPAPPPDPTPAAAADGAPALTVYRALMARDVADRAPVGEATTFPVSAGTVYCYTEVGPAPGEAGGQLIHRWSLDGKSQGDTRLRVGGDHWRTFSNRTITEAKRGAWKVQLLDERGNVLRTLEFTVE
jgi:Protein of unknown function (DUF2914)